MYATGYGYDALDRVITTTYPTGEVVTQTYNAQGLLENVRSVNWAGTPGQWYVKNLDYNANGSPTLGQWGNTVNTTYTYFPLSFRLQRIAAGAVLTLTYGSDAVGNITTITDTATFLMALTQVQNLRYDDLDRLTRVISVTNGFTGTYLYNAIGNLISKRESGALITYTYGLTQPHAVRTLTNGGAYTYDLNGNTPALALRASAVQVCRRAWRLV